MSSFQFKDTKKELEIQNNNGEVVKTFSVDIGNYDTLKGWSGQLDTVKKIASKLTDDGSIPVEVIDQVKAVCEKVIPFILGQGSFEFVWELSGQNIFACLAFVRYLSEFIQEQMAEIHKEYV